MSAARYGEMSVFKRKKKNESLPVYPPEEDEPVIRCSICTGEQVGCMRDRSTGKLHELMLIRSEEDLESFCRQTGAEADKIKRVY